MAQWIKFKELRQKLDFASVLKHYGIELRVKGEQHQGLCPLPGHKGEKHPSFSANLQRGIFQCFGCQAKGNVLDFVALMENLDPTNGEDFRKAALIAEERFVRAAAAPTEGTGRESNLPDQQTTRAQTAPAPEPKGEPAAAAPQTVINAPLDFELKGLDPKHPYLAGRGFAVETIAHFGLGYCARGVMQGRIAIPLHDAQGKLIGYAGRLVDHSAVTEENPKYRFPSKRARAGVVHEFRKSAFIYNGHRVVRPVDNIFLVEGFPAVWWLWQAGYVNVVGLMGATCSDAQANLIVDLLAPAGHVWVFPDGDAAGNACAESVLVRVAPHRFTRWVKLTPGRQPTDCSPDELRTLFGHGGVRNSQRCGSSPMSLKPSRSLRAALVGQPTRRSSSCAR